MLLQNIYTEDLSRWQRLCVNLNNMHLTFLKWARKGDGRTQTQIGGVLRRGEGRRGKRGGGRYGGKGSKRGEEGKIIRPGLAGIPPCRFLQGL